MHAFTSYASFHLDYGAVQPGTTVGDRFEILSALDGDVYRARDRMTGSDVALKIGAAGRFAREIEVISKLEDPRIVRHLAHGELPSGDLFVALEWLDAETIFDRMNVGFTARESVEVAAAIARALAALHARGIVHRDLAPAHVMLMKTGDVKLIDFGFAWAPDSPELTQAGSVLGTLGYIAPEQISAEGRVDVRADLFALGCLLYLMLTGQSAFHADTLMGMQARIMFSDPIPVGDRVPALPPALDALVRALLAKDPAQRPTSALDVAAELDAFAKALDNTVKRPLGAERKTVIEGERSVVMTDAAPEKVQAVVRGVGAQITAMIGGGALLDTHSSDPQQTDVVIELQKAIPNAKVWVERVGRETSPAAAYEKTVTPEHLGSAPVSERTESFVTKGTQRYELKGVIGQGGLGRVILAHDKELDRPVAIKELLRRTPINTERFLREALVTAKLQHPNIVPVHDAGRWPNGAPFYAMKLVEGDDLTKFIERAPDLASRLALLPKMIAVCEAMAYAHDRRIIHRDLKPSNIVVGSFGEALIVDWGLAKSLDVEDKSHEVDDGDAYRTAAPGPELTRAGDIVGTPAYMAPEQAQGERVDERTDVYALGAIMYTMLCGHAPYADGPATTMRVLAGESPSPVEQLAPDAPAELLAIVRKAMAREPADRYATALELARELRAFEAGQIVSAHRYSFGEIVRRWARRHRTALVVAGVLATALLVVGAYSLYRVLAAERVAQKERTFAIAEHGRAKAESLRLRVLQAEGALERDPTEAIAWLAIEDKLPDDLHQRAVAVASKAVALGVAHTVHRLRGRVHWLEAAGDHVAAASQSGEIGVWTRAGNPVLRTDVGEAAHVAALSADGKQLLVTTADGRVRWWRDLAGAPVELKVGALPRHATFVKNDLVAIASDDGTVTMWPLRGERRAHAIHTGEVYALAAVGGDAFTVSGDGDLVRIGIDGVLWRVKAHTGGANHVARASDDRVVTVGDDAAIRVWRIDDGSKLAEIIADEPLREVAAAGEEVLAIASNTKTFHRWRTTQTTITKVAAAFAGRGAVAQPTFIAVGTGPAASVFRADGVQLSLTGHPDQVEKVTALGPDELASADRGGQIRFWRLAPSDRVVAATRVKTTPVRVANGWLVGDETGAVVEVSRDGTTRTVFQLGEPIKTVKATADGAVVVAIAGKRTHVWRSGVVTELAVPESHYLHLTDDGNYIVVTTTASNELQVWRTTDGVKQRTELATRGFLSLDGSRVYWVHPAQGVVSLDLAQPSAALVTINNAHAIAGVGLGRAMAIGDDAGHVHVVSDGGAPIAKHDFATDLFSLAPARNELLFGGADGVIRAWQWESDRVRTFVGHPRWVHGIDVAGRFAGSWSRSQPEVRLWDLESGATRSILTAANAQGAALDTGATAIAIVDKTGALVVAKVGDLVAIPSAGLAAWVRARTAEHR